MKTLFGKKQRAPLSVVALPHGGYLLQLLSFEEEGGATSKAAAAAGLQQVAELAVASGPQAGTILRLVRARFVPLCTAALFAISLSGWWELV